MWVGLKAIETSKNNVGKIGIIGKIIKYDIFFKTDLKMVFQFVT